MKKILQYVHYSILILKLQVRISLKEDFFAMLALGSRLDCKKHVNIRRIFCNFTSHPLFLVLDLALIFDFRKNYYELNKCFEISN